MAIAKLSLKRAVIFRSFFREKLLNIILGARQTTVHPSYESILDSIYGKSH